jgi:Holliday junction resolvase RusA-like endonuclease
LIYFIDPCAKVRQSQSDKWKKRPCVMRYRAFADEVRRLGITLQDGDAVEFRIAMPKSWSEKKMTAMLGQPHRQKPDLDNLLGGLMDAAMPDSDCHVAWLERVSKRWAVVGSIRIVRQSAPLGPREPGCTASPESSLAKCRTKHRR